MNFKNFAEEYKYFVRTHVLPLMGVPNGNICIHDSVNAIDIPDEAKSKAVYMDTESVLYFSSGAVAQFHIKFVRGFSDDAINLADNLCRAFFEVSTFSFASPTKKKMRYASDAYQTQMYQAAVQHGICTWVVGKKCTAVEKLLALMEKWAVQTYEGKNVTFGFVINPTDTSAPKLKPNAWLKFLEDDYSAVLTDCIHSVIQLNANCDFIQFLSLAENGTIPAHTLSPLLPLRFSHCIDKYITGSAVGLFLLNNGDIVLSKDRKIQLVKRNLHWLNFSFDAFRNAVCETDMSWDQRLLEEIYATTLDVSFAHTGGIISAVEDLKQLRQQPSPILKDCDDLKTPYQVASRKKLSKDDEIKELKRNVILELVGRKNFCEIDRKLRSELTAMDGACILDKGGNVISFGAIIRNDADSSGGARGAASKTLSKHGLAVKISTDGYVELYIGGEKVFSIK